MTLPARKILLAIAVLLFLAFLVSPAFVDSVTGDGTVTMLPGYGSILWWLIILPYSVLHFPREGLVLVPVLLADVAFLALPVLVVLRRFRSLVLRTMFYFLFVAGFISMAWIIGTSERVGFGVYLWLLAAVAAAAFCFLPPYDT